VFLKASNHFKIVSGNLSKINKPLEVLRKGESKEVPKKF
jgi:hypothetical protein